MPGMSMYNRDELMEQMAGYGGDYEEEDGAWRFGPGGRGLGRA